MELEHTSVVDNAAAGVAITLLESYRGPTSSIMDSDIARNGFMGVYLGAPSNLPASYWPHGNRNNIYANASRQLAVHQVKRQVDWSGNFFGQGVTFKYNDPVCLTESPYSAGQLVGAAGEDVISKSAYLVDMPYPQQDVLCYFDYIEIGPSEFSRTYIEGAGVPVGQTLGGPGSGHANNPTGYQSDPVNSATGSFYSRETDLALTGIEVPFVLARTYNSLDVDKGPLGLGWSHSLGARLKVWPHGDVKLIAEDGQRVTYTKQADGSFEGAPGARSTLAAVTGGYKLVRRDQVAYRFDTAGKLTSMKGRNGKGLTLAYGPDGQISTVTDSVGRTITFTHAGGLLTRVELPDGRVVTYSYTEGLLTSVTDTPGGVTTYTYNSMGWLKSKTDENNHTVYTNAYATSGQNAGRVTSQTDARGNTSTFAWDGATQTSTMTDSRGNAWKDVYSSGKLVERIDPLGNSYRFSYDSDLNVTAATDPRGNTTTMTYGALGNMMSRTASAPLSYQEGFTYDSYNNLTSYTDRRSITTSFTYDTRGNLDQIIQPGTIVTDFDRDPATGLVTSIADPRGKTTTLGYDTDGNLTSVTKPSGAETTFGYDASGRMTSFVDPRGNESGATPADYTWTLSYDASDHLTAVTDPLGNRTEWAYDPAGNLDFVKDAKLRKTNYSYLPNNLLKKVIAPDLTETVYDYDKTGNLVSRTDAKLHTTTYSYNPANLIDSVALPDGQTWTYAYDKNGNVKSVVDAEGNATTGDPTDGKTAFSYDEINRLSAVDYSDQTPDVTFTYDANSNRKTMTDGAGTESYAYDDLNRLTSAGRGTQAFSYLYDAASNVTRRTYPDGTVVDYAYTDDGQLDTVTSAGDVTDYAYDAAGLLTTTTLPTANGHTETRAYDRAGRLASLENAANSPVLSKFVYNLDEVGNPTAITDHNGDVTSYLYDPNRDFVTEACYQSSCPSPSDPYIRYEYDPVGNLTSEIRPAGTTTYAYDASDRLQSSTDPAGTTNYSFDRNGNMTQAGSRTYAYDLARRMKSTSDGTATITYAYDGDGKRLSASSGAHAQDTTNYLWDPNWALYQLAGESDGSDALLRRHVHGNDLISMTAGGSDYFFHYDGLGSVTDVTDATGAPQWNHVYEPFGAARATTKIDPAAPDSVMRFTGELLDLDTNLYHLRARQYDPTLSFTAFDPWPSSMSTPALSPYAYANNLPAVLTDPSGLCPWCAGALIGGVIGGISGGLGALASGGGLGDVAQGAIGGAASGALAGIVPLLGPWASGAIAGATGNMIGQAATGSPINSCSVAVSAVTGSLGGGVGHAFGGLAKLIGIRSAGQAALGASLGGWAELVPGAIGSQLCGASSQTPTSK